METRWLYTTSEQFPMLRKACKDTCIVPIGCVEKHGYHLPLGTDIIQASQIAWMASQIEPVCVFPDFTFGDLGESSPSTPPGCITLTVEMEMLLLTQLCEQIVRNGFRKIIIYNGHGGNNAWLSVFMKNMKLQHPDYDITQVNIVCNIIGRIAQRLIQKGSGVFPELTSEDEEFILDKYRQRPRDGHGGYSEAAYILGTCPESATLDRLGVLDGANQRLSQKYKDAGFLIRDDGWEVDFPNWFDSDDPIGCNERIGQTALRIEAERVAKAIRKVKGR